MSDDKNTVDYLKDLEQENDALQAKVRELKGQVADYAEQFETRDAYGQMQAKISDLEAKLRQVEEELSEGKGYLIRLFALLAPQCKPLETLPGVATQIDNYIAGLKQSRDQLRARVGELEEALQASRIGLDDWLNQYASALCDEERVKEARERIADNRGTLAYIAQLQDQNRRALEGKEEHGSDR